MKKLIITAIVLMLSGCSWYVRYPSIGKSSTSANRPTNWRGQTCVLTLDSTTGAKVYRCGPDRFRWDNK